jgi:glycerophosphoryl diester phosphodiesterase
MDWPENTIEGFLRAAVLHPDMLIETDVSSTKDGALVLMHDETVDRTTDGTGEVSEMTFQQVRALDAGYRFRDRDGAYSFRGRGVRVPTLAEALRAVPRHRMLLDLKRGSDPAEVIRVIREERAMSRVIIGSFIPEIMAEVRRLAPEIPTCYDLTQGMRLLAALRGGDWEAYRPQAQILSMMKEHVAEFRITDDELRRIRAKGILVHIHTLNSDADVARWRDLVDGYLTGDPRLLPAAARPSF